MTHYTTEGDVRGSCGHKHRSLRTALRCLGADISGCAKQGGYSDRRVKELLRDGSTRFLSVEATAHLDAVLNGDASL